MGVAGGAVGVGVGVAVAVGLGVGADVGVAVGVGVGVAVGFGVAVGVAVGVGVRIGVAVGVGVGVGVAVGDGVGICCNMLNAAARSNVPPVVTFPVNDVSGLAELSIAALICAAVALGNAALSKAAAPVRCGVAIDVPE